MNEMTLTTEKLDEIERLAELATPGPWEPNDKRPVGGHGFSLFAGSQYIGHVGDSDGKTPCEANATYIAALDPATVRELVRLARIGERHETRPDPLGDAMNSGDGVYRP